MFKQLFFCVFSICCACPTYAQETWKWSDEQASIFYSFLNTSNQYRVELVRGEKADWSDFKVKFSSGEENLLTIKTHMEGAFVMKGSIVVYAQYHMMSSGCELRAYDLEKQEELWSTQLDGLGMVDHSKYRNRINMELRGDQVLVYGNESAGQYIEVRDTQSGDLYSHAVGTAEYRRFSER